MRFIKLLFSNMKSFIYKLNNDNVSEYAAECAFFTILSFIPLIIFLLSLIQFANIDKETIFIVTKNFIPESMYDFIYKIVNEAYEKSFGTISISAIVALWSGARGFFSLCKGFKKIYNTEKKSNKFFIRIEGVIYTFIFIIIFIITLLILVFGNRILNQLKENFYFLKYILEKILKLKFLVIIFVLFIIFELLYKIVSNNKINIKYQIPGSIFASIGWYLTSIVFSLYVDIFQGFTNMYGSLSSIILIMMWVYVCSYIILLGAEINFIYFNKKNIKLLS